MAGTGTGNWSGDGELDLAGVDADPAVGLERGEGVDEGGVAQAAGVAELAACQRGRGVAEGVQDALGGRARALGRRRADVFADIQREPTATIGRRAGPFSLPPR